MKLQWEFDDYGGASITLGPYIRLEVAAILGRYTASAYLNDSFPEKEYFSTQQEGIDWCERAVATFFLREVLKKLFNKESYLLELKTVLDHY